MHLRDATASDRDLLIDLVVAAVDWQDGADGADVWTRERVLADDHLARYVEGWLRAGDAGVVAVDDDGAPLGAAWLRLLTAERPGYGFVAADVPELSMAVLDGGRGSGAGSELLDGCVRLAREAGNRAVSLSVEDGNDRARGMYERRGFVPVGRVGGSDTLLLTF
jgi:ribosomal protein S18 acetylase RimI-like enzyme